MFFLDGKGQNSLSNHEQVMIGQHKSIEVVKIHWFCNSSLLLKKKLDMHKNHIFALFSKSCQVRIFSSTVSERYCPDLSNGVGFINDIFFLTQTSFCPTVPPQKSFSSCMALNYIVIYLLEKLLI